ncbi:MAG: MATE family efflux transporter [Bacteroidales bacterium]|nr:MATE family efflux transporter [Bacteroidales bacterium]
MQTLDDKYREMTQTPVSRLVWRLAIPSMISMIVTALYNVVDAAFVAHISTEANAGVGISFAYMTFIQAVGFFFGHGSGNYISRALGARHKENAETMAVIGVGTSFLIGLLSAVTGSLFLSRLVVLLGARPDVAPHACDYLRWILLASPFMMSALTLNNQLRLQGNARFGMIGIVSGALLNIALDPLLIIGLGMGVEGASLATAISQFVAFGLLLSGTFRSQSVHIHLSKFRPSWHWYGEILAGGLPSLFRQLFNCCSAICLNYAAASWAPLGQEASSVAAFTDVSRTTMFAYSLVLGYLQGFQPVAGYNYGAHNYLRVRNAYLYAAAVATAMLTLFSLGGYIFAPQIIAFFRAEDPALIAIGARALRWQCVVFPLVPMCSATNMLFQNIRMTFRSTLLSIGRQGLFFIPALLVMPQLWGLHGVEASQAVADVFTFLLSLPFAIWITRKLTRMAVGEASR